MIKADPTMLADLGPPGESLQIAAKQPLLCGDDGKALPPQSID